MNTPPARTLNGSDCTAGYRAPLPDARPRHGFRHEVYERYEALSRQRARLDSALASAQSVQAELPGPFSPDHDREVAAYVDGEIGAAELYRRTVARYRKP
ncbi:MAG TPA: hypothetical protein VHN16_04910 [Streptosporangiaceae bacterium]|nr:hypothetical protein [Streptosporangiaceae bacterium]